MRWLLLLVLASLSIVGCAARPKPSASAIDPDRVIDLSYSFNEQTIYWPTAQPFRMQRVAWGMTPGGYF